jgi:hypothetical protein
VHATEDNLLGPEDFVVDAYVEQVMTMGGHRIFAMGIQNQTKIQCNLKVPSLFIAELPHCSV